MNLATETMGTKEESLTKELEGTCNRASVLLNQRVEGSSGTNEEIPPIKQWRRQNLFLEIPLRKVTSLSEDFVRINMPPTPSPLPTRAGLPPTPSSSSARKNGSSGPSSSRSKSSRKSLLPRLSFKYQNSTSEIEKAAIVAGISPSSGPRKKPFIVRSFSLTNIFTPRIRRTSSLPVTPIAPQNSESVDGGTTVDSVNESKKGAQRYISRSLSVPSNNKGRSIRRMDSSASKFRVIPSTPRVTEGTGAASTITPTVDSDNNDADGEDIPEEEAVCRICFIELGEGGETLKLECNCKGELALAHQECAVKWFSIKGNMNCDVCKQEVQNLPVTLLRIQSIQSPNGNANRGQQTAAHRFRVWQDVPILVIISMLAYFCFLEQLLVSKMGTGAIAISLPFSCMLGLLASMASSTMVERKFVWVYASMQYALVVLFAHLFYSLLHVQAILSILFSTFVGLGVTMSISSLLIEFLRWRRRWHARSDNHRSSQEIQRESPVSADSTGQIGFSDHHDTGMRSLGTPRES